jgi:hypothetical protein
MKQFQVDTGGTLTTNLVSYYQLYESSGSTATDFYDSNNGTYAGNIPNRVAGKVSFAQDFDGNDDYITLFNHNNDQDFSISVWVNIDDLSSRREILSNDTDNGAPRGFQFSIDTDGSVDFFDGNTLFAGTASKVTTAGGWFHIVLTYNNTTGALKTYINNVTDQDTTANINAVTKQLTVGVRSVSDKVNDMDGQICELGIWNKVLSSQEIADLYNSGSGQTMISSAIKSFNGLAYASIKSINGLAIASIKNINGLA